MRADANDQWQEWQESDNPIRRKEKERKREGRNSEKGRENGRFNTEGRVWISRDHHANTS
jgi:hypothetical protein